MIKRFQIEDIIVQNREGVTFCAMDSVTDTLVAVRRFFPFGADGGGLQKEEEAAYNVAIERLAGVKHPSLRSVITGGCDPIDSMPYIATEWIEGDLLSNMVEGGPLSTEAVVDLVSKALEVCELLSHVLAEEAIWVETELRTIIVANPPDTRGATFWISPLKWLGGIQAQGYDSIVTLAEDALGWKGRIVGDQAGRGLGGWIKWLRTVPPTTPLREIRESLAAAVGAKPPPPVVSVRAGTGLVSKAPTVRAATRQMASPVAALPVTKPRTNRLLFIILALAILLAGGAAWWLTQDPTHASVDESGPPMTDLERVNRRAAELADQPVSGNTARAAPSAKTVKGEISWDQRDVLISHNKQIVTLTGLVSRTAKSNSGKTLYLLFSGDPKSARVGIKVEDKNLEAVKKRFDSLIDKKIVVTGTVNFNSTIGNRPEIIIGSLDDVKSKD